MDQYSASAEDQDTIDYLLERKDNIATPKNTQYPVTYLIESGQDAHY